MKSSKPFILSYFFFKKIKYKRTLNFFEIIILKMYILQYQYSTN